MKFKLAQGLTFIGWMTVVMSAFCGLLAVPLFLLELREPVSSGNEGVTGLAILAVWILYVIGFSLVILGKFLGKKPYQKVAKYGALIFIGQLLLVLFLSYLFPDSREWIWKF